MSDSTQPSAPSQVIPLDYEVASVRCTPGEVRNRVVGLWLVLGSVAAAMVLPVCLAVVRPSGMIVGFALDRFPAALLLAGVWLVSGRDSRAPDASKLPTRLLRLSAITLLLASPAIELAMAMSMSLVTAQSLRNARGLILAILLGVTGMQLLWHLGRIGRRSEDASPSRHAFAVGVLWAIGITAMGLLPFLDTEALGPAAALVFLLAFCAVVFVVWWSIVLVCRVLIEASRGWRSMP